MSVLVIFFADNQWLQYRQIGLWASHANGDKTYLGLIFIAMSAQAWQILAGSLAG